MFIKGTKKIIIKRDLYLNKLISRKNNGLIKVITGIRRSGKSFLLFNLFKNYLINEGVREDHIIELNFDEFDNIKYCNPNNASPYLKGKIVDADMYYFLLDEIQLLNCFESVLNGLLRYNNVDIYVTGSNAKFLSKDVITEFRGRGDLVHVYPLSFSEFYEAKNIDKYDSLDEYLTFGGIPLIISMNTYESKISFLKIYLLKHILKILLIEIICLKLKKCKNL